MENTEALISESYPFSIFAAGVYIVLIWPIYILIPVVQLIEKAFESE